MVVEKSKQTSEEERIVFLKKIKRRPQWVKCPFYQHKIRAQWIHDGVMTGWDEDCGHYYAADNNSATEPALVFRFPNR